MCPSPNSNNLHHHIHGPLYPLLFPNPLPSSNHHTVVCVYEFQFYILHMNEIMWFLVFFCLTDFAYNILEVHFVVTNDSYLVAEQYFIVYMYHIFFIQSSIKEHFGCFYVLVTMLISLQINILDVFWWIPRRGIAVPYDNSIFTFVRNCPTVFHSGCPSLHSNQQ